MPTLSDWDQLDGFNPPEVPRGNGELSWNELRPEPALFGRQFAYSRQGVVLWTARIKRELRNLQLESTRALVAAVDARDPYTRLHSVAVAAFADAIARRLHLRKGMLDTIRVASLLHDVGKIGLPDAVLFKPGPLTPDEFDIVKRHPQTALDILSPLQHLHDTRPLILHHHERFDGNGYPEGLSGDRIPVGARILAVADAVDTMLSARVYKSAYDMGRVRRELEIGAGRQFDPEVVSKTLRYLDQSTASTAPPRHDAPLEVSLEAKTA